MTHTGNQTRDQGLSMDLLVHYFFFKTNLRLSVVVLIKVGELTSCIL